MNDLQVLRQRLEQVPVSELPRHAKASKVPFGTLQKIKYGTTKNPRFTTVQKLLLYFGKAE